ncbi:hypothetical protein COHA_008474 [Chlorella ohadii]|uniref:Uncharacterized protein n=1 Tax=Chlorella ohadii TaxID=2649997 RepID=A0AAD5GYR9_9CHLO|nr:hypothetical protein COHA_008474 [Chlorella ohadii]
MGRAGALGASAAAAAAGSRLWGRRLGGSPAAGGIAGLGGMVAAEASFFTQHGEQGGAKDEDLGDLRPGMTLSEEEDDEAEHYAVRAHIHRRRLKQREEERHLDEEETPAEEAPGEEAYKEAGPLLPPDSEEEVGGGGRAEIFGTCCRPATCICEAQVASSGARLCSAAIMSFAPSPTEQDILSDEELEARK